jgi:long-chain acyl-CoA synthetase
MHELATDILGGLPSRISDVLRLWSERLPDHPAIIESSGVWTGAQLVRAVEVAREWLARSGVRAGDRVMIVCDNCRGAVAVLFAAAQLDAWGVPVNARLSAREIDEIRDHCQPRRAIFTTAVSPEAAKHAERHAAQIQAPQPLEGLVMGPLNEAALPEPIFKSGEEQVAVLIYTSGTTGKPKGVMLTHRNILFVAAISGRIRSLTPQDRLYGVMPLSHVVGLCAVLMGALFAGASLFLVPRLEPLMAAADIKKQGLTVVLGAPAMYALLVDYAARRKINRFDFPSLRIISSSGAPLTSELKTKVEAVFGMPLCNGYGVTECSPTISMVLPEFTRRDTSVGPIFPGVEARLVGRDGVEAAPGEVGILLARGPNVMKGYYRAPEETAEVLSPEGWFNTRDLARLENGNLFIVGRAKDLIVRFGFNVYPAEVEAVMESHAGVKRAAVIGRNDKETGEEQVIAFVQLEEGLALSVAELAQYASEQLAFYKRPSEIHVVPDMPLTSTGKVRKQELIKPPPAAI